MTKILSEEKYLVALCSFVYFGPVRTKLLIDYFGGAKNVWFADKRKLIEVGLKDKMVNDFNAHRNNFDIESYFQKLEKMNVGILTKEGANYPSQLLEIDDAPSVLYYLGNLKYLSEGIFVSVVGARKMTSYGREVSGKIAASLANYEITTVSGFARGIDTNVHKTSIENGGKTIAVLPCGIDIIYPPENHQLYKKIVENGIVITEYPLSYPPLRVNFASRNRIISGISNIVVVVEGEKKSGTLLTASKAADQGRTVFAVPGPITSPMSEAPHYLIQNGARIFFSVEDVVRELDVEIKARKPKIANTDKLDKVEKKVLEIVEKEGVHLDEIARILKLDVSLVSATLMVMQLKGIVKDLGDGIYKKV